MHRQVLKLVAHTFADLMRRRLPPSGQPHLHDFEARAMVLVDRLPPHMAPAVGTPDTLDEAGVAAAFEWLFTALAAANAGDSWAQLAIQVLRLYALARVPEVLLAIARPPRTLAAPDPAPGP